MVIFFKNHLKNTHNFHIYFFKVLLSTFPFELTYL